MWLSPQCTCWKSDRAEQSPRWALIQGGLAGGSLLVLHPNTSAPRRAPAQLLRPGCAAGERHSLLPTCAFPALGIWQGPAWGREQINPHTSVWRAPNSSFSHTNTHCRNMVTPVTWKVKWDEVCPRNLDTVWNQFQFILLYLHCVSTFSLLPACLATWSTTCIWIN